MPLRGPDHFPQAFEHRVQRRVLVAARGADPLEMGANARRLVDRELLGDGEVQRQVQERIDLAALRLPVAIEMALRRFEDRVVFRVERDQLRRDPLEPATAARAREISSTRRSGSGAPRRARD